MDTTVIRILRSVISHMKTLSIIIPVYNEQERLEKTFEALRELQVSRGLKLEKIIFVDDGSIDDTKNIIKRFINSSRFLHRPRSPSRCLATSEVSFSHIQLITYKTNRGKGYAISRGMKESNSDYTLFCDADMSTHVNEIKKFMPAIRDGVPVIVGTRKNGHSTVVRHQPIMRELLGKCFTLLSQIILNTWVTDFTCGFKAFSKEAKDTLFPILKVKRWGYDAELLFLGRLSGFEMKEVPVVWSDDRRSKVRMWKDAPKSLVDLVCVRILHLTNGYEGIKPYIFPRPDLSFVRNIKSFLF